jgi:hypothetical protein
MSDDIQGSLGLGGRHAGLEFGGDAITAAGAVGGGEQRGGKDGPHVDFVFGRKGEAWRSDADHGVGRAVEADGFARKSWISAISAAPEIVAQQDAALTAVRVFGGEQAAKRGRSGKRGKNVGRNDGSADAFGIADALSRGGVTPRKPNNHVGEDASGAGLPVAVVGNGSTNLVEALRFGAMFPDVNPAVGVDGAVRAEENGVDQREYGGDGGDAESQG